MSTSATGPSATGTSTNRRYVVIAAAVVIALAVVVLVVVLVPRNGDSATVPPLTPAEQRAGAVRVTYPDRSLPDQPEVVTVGGQRVALYFVSASGSGDDASAVLRVGTDATSGGVAPTVMLTKGQTKLVNGLAVTLLEAFHTGDLGKDAADVTVTAP